MNTPLCNFCIKSGILCQKCQTKVESRQISETDISIAKLLLQLEEKYSSLQSVHFNNAYDLNGVLAIVVGQGDLPKFLVDSGKIIKNISYKIRKQIRILEKEGSSRKFLEDLFSPVTITAINKIWLPDGSEETRVILPGRPRRLPLKIADIKELAKRIKGITIRIAFERAR